MMAFSDSAHPWIDFIGTDPNVELEFGKIYHMEYKFKQDSEWNLLIPVNTITDSTVKISMLASSQPDGIERYELLSLSQLKGEYLKNLRIREVPLRDLPLYIGSPSTSMLFEWMIREGKYPDMEILEKG